MYIYRTYFKLTAYVLDLDEANRFLQEDDMTGYLKHDSRIPKTLQESIDKIEWHLTDEESGNIELISDKELSSDELNIISNWVIGQCSDGLGESFEQQDFACYEVDEDGDVLDRRRAWDYDGETEEVMASFDYKKNSYTFEFIRKD